MSEELVVFWGVFVFWLGACLGSFANVIILRLPEGKSIAFPGSHCPHCKTKIRWYDNIPLVSWWILRGRCRACKKTIAFQYFLVEALTAFIFTGVYLKYGFSWTGIEFFVFAFSLIIVSFIDLKHMILPDVFTLSGILMGLFGAWLNPEREFLAAFWGVLMGGGFFWLIAYLYQVLRKAEGLGGGDIKLLAWIGAILGWKAIPYVILVSSISGSVIGIALALRRGSDLKTVIPFGPFLSLAALTYLLGGDEVGAWYLRFFFPWL